MKRAFVYIMGILTRPRQGFTLILFDAQSLSVSFLLLLASAVAWATAVFGLALAALEPWATPWLVIPSSEYYYWEALFALPVILTGWVLASGFAQLMSHQVGGGGSFEATAKLLALSIAVSSLVHVIPVLALAFIALGGALDAAWWLHAFRADSAATGVVWLLMLAEAVWMSTLTAMAVRAAHKLRSRASLFVAIPTVVLYYGFVLVFLR